MTGSGTAGRPLLLAVAAALIAAGLILRLVPWGLPLAVHHSGGGFLWGATIYALVAAARPPGWRVPICLVAALAIIAAVECSRLVHAPLLDGFRATLAGQLLLGRIFSPLNIAVDGFGALVLAGASVRVVQRRPPMSAGPRASL